MTALAALTAPLVIGFDLDLTLIDTRAATAYALRVVNAELGTTVDVEAFVANLGPPLHTELLRWIPEDGIDEAVAVFRRAFVAGGLEHLTPYPAARAALRLPAATGGRSIVITSRRPDIAAAALRATGLEPHVIVGDANGLQKSAPMLEHGVALYVGDHPLDMQGACAAGVLAVGVLTGEHDETALRDAGASVVVATLEELVRQLKR